MNMGVVAGGRLSSNPPCCQDAGTSVESILGHQNHVSFSFPSYTTLHFTLPRIDMALLTVSYGSTLCIIC